MQQPSLLLYPDILQNIFDNIDDSDDEDLIFLAAIQEEENARERQFVRRRGSIMGHRVINRSRHDGAERLYCDYFSENSTYPPHLFRRRFRISRPLFCRIVEGVVASNDYFRQRTDAIGVVGLSSIQKVTAAMRMLAYGQPVDSIDEYVRIGESTVLECLRKFVVTIVNVFCPHYLRAPNNDDVAKLCALREESGFPGMLGSIDCMYWKWKNCPTANHGQYTDHCHFPTIILEVVTSSDLWI
ncbi:hypothetical protein Dimus_039596 [Dionaea muscipula]